MDYLDTVLQRLADARICRYGPDSPAAAEPTALAALALLAHGRHTAAQRHVDRLLELRGPDGCVGIARAEVEPGWPTGLAVLAWRATQKSPIFDVNYVTALDHALKWILNTEGTLPDLVDFQGREQRVRGWPWVEGTYSWVEPTAMNLLALKHSRFVRHARAREATLLLIHRLIESGGCNYGNTIVFGQTLRPHVQPTGICLLALAGEEDTTGRIGRSIDYLARELSPATATASLCWGLLGLAAQNAFPDRAAEDLQAAARRALERDAPSYKLALLALAALGTECPLISRVSCLEPQTA